MKQWSWILVLVLSVTLLAGAGCGGDDGDDSSMDFNTAGDSSGDAGDASGDGSSSSSSPADPAAPAAPAVPAAALTAPGLVAPADNSYWNARTGTYTITLVWNSVDGAESYLVVINNREYSVTGTSYELSGTPGTYTWRVAAVRGTEEAWSSSRDFTFYTM